MNKDSVAVVTGANSGMGKATSIAIAKTGATVVMVCRHRERGEEARKEVQEMSGNSAVVLMQCDLGSKDSIRSFCTTFKDSYQRLDVLVNNAGVILPGRHETSDGFELQFGVNHLGHFLLTKLLLEQIIASAPARIINVSSGAHKIGKIHFENINLTKNYRLWRAYGQSKLANILFTYELADRLKEKGVTVNCLNPGAVATNMGINRNTGFGTFITRILKPYFQTAEQGAETAIYLATADEVAGVTGHYFYRKKQIKSSKKSYDKNLAKRLWSLSETLTD
ncbi:SDR family NAD(P)-dependent oxidoreductase [Aquibacillus halophilus]|uniref:SDR family NAD(P)-dependent oxidoreductase n=1 Tax=Aquibacillus halophilus TaxID=930132 RepID=A0A6A8DGU7_9BACI|nr:SDR family oxidoreductase [Aquibacillus halophilus]MRH44460.1 SDR family NAD(P)-dependent oxidoreductase [Aquibacillus halophilus]